MFAPPKPTTSAQFDQIVLRIQAIVDDEQQRKELLRSRGNVAQDWLDLLQLLLEYPNLPKTLRPSIFMLMTRLSKKSGLYPQCLAITGVEKLGNHPIGGGSFGDVWKGRIGQQIVCLKVVRVFNSSDVESVLQNYMQEGTLWRQLKHPNVLPFMGMYYLDPEQRQVCLVSPWMERGNLVDFLKTSRDVADLDLLAYDVACGLSYLHTMKIVHSDLKGVNILITLDLRACIADFGLSRVSATQCLLSGSTRPKGTIRWLSPELLDPKSSCLPTRPSDVYAFACVCYEIFTGRFPFHEVAEAAIVIAIYINKQRPSRPDDCPPLRDPMWKLMEACWNEEPSLRPTMVQVLDRIQEINPDRRLEPASSWREPAFTQIWSNLNDVDRSPVIHIAGTASLPDTRPVRPADPPVNMPTQSRSTTTPSSLFSAQLASLSSMPQKPGSTLKDPRDPEGPLVSSSGLHSWKDGGVPSQSRAEEHQVKDYKWKHEQAKTELRSVKATPTQGSVELPRAQTNDRAGCWTCGIRRKRCDLERLEGNTCRTCKDVKIECLGWSARRPDWMRNKQAVDEYRAQIKAQLRRRSARTGSGGTAGSARRSPNPGLSLEVSTGFGMGGYNYYNMLAGTPSDSPFGRSNALGTSSGYDYSSGTSTSPTDIGYTAHHGGPPTPQPPDIGIPMFSVLGSIQEGHVIYYFENGWRVHFMLSNHLVMNTTFELIVQDPRGALTNAVCALANLHYTHLRVSQGLEAPDPNPEHSVAKYYYDEAYFQLVNAKQIRGSYTETDVLAALHLVYYSQLSGGSTDWDSVLGVALDWLLGTGLTIDDNPGIIVGMMGIAGQLGVKCTMMIDILSSLTLRRPPKYIPLYQRLLSRTDTNLLLQPRGGMQMEVLSGCPDEAWLAIAEVSVLAYWKSTEERRGCLSPRELVRRGDDIERRLRSNISAANANASVEGAVLNDEVRRVIVGIYRETALLYLHTVVNNPSPAVHEISASVDNLVGMIRQLPPSDTDRTLVFPICLAGSMTDSPLHREFFKERLQAQDETIGNTMKIRFLMEGVWQKRDVSGGHVDWREMMSNRSINLLLI